MPPDREHYNEGKSELSLKQQPHFHHGIASDQLPWKKQDKCAGGRGGACDDGRRSEPAVDLATIEHNFETAEYERDQQNSEPINPHSSREPLRPLTPKHLRLCHEPPHQGKRDEPDGHVDEENPAPGVVVGDPAAERGTDCRRHYDRNAVEREGLWTLLGQECVGEHCLLARGHSAAAEPLQDAKQDQRAETGAQARIGGKPA